MGSNHASIDRRINVILRIGVGSGAWIGGGFRMFNIEYH